MRARCIGSLRAVKRPRATIGAEENHLPETDARPARRRARAASRPNGPTNGAPPIAPADESPLLAAVLAAQKSYRFGDIELPPTIARAIEKMGFVQPTEVQARAIGPLRSGKDPFGQALTGTGKA